MSIPAMAMRSVLLCCCVLAAACGARSGLTAPDLDASTPPLEPPQPEPAPPELDAGRASSTTVAVAAFKRDPDQALADKIDLLFVVDDSGSMLDKQRLLQRAIPDLVTRLTHPLCVDSQGRPVGQQPDDVDSKCPGSSVREFNTVQDMHIGVITSSVGAAGVCLGGSQRYASAHLVEGPGYRTYQNMGFLAWDPNGLKDPPGERDQINLAITIGDMVTQGQGGCGDEASLEAFYRFLMEPDPHASLDPVDCDPGSGLLDCEVVAGLDTTVLEQRAGFLRPDSLLAIILLSDENDCSIMPGGDAARFLVGRAPMPRATSICETAPLDDCCHSCGDPAPAGCPDPGIDSECIKGPYTEQEDPLIQRCWDQKRRFGVERRYPVQRYIDGLTKAFIPDRTGRMVSNPIFSDLSGGDAPPRSPSLVFLATIVGVPWQDIAVNPDDEDILDYLSADELSLRDQWSVILGDPRTNTPPGDPLMIESLEERTGTNPITGDAIAPSTATSATANPINGHEMALLSADTGTLRADLQYACIFPLEERRNCNLNFGGCDCRASAAILRKPICQDPNTGVYSTTQWAAKAYPGPRQLEVARGIGSNAIVASICARNSDRVNEPDFGYRPALRAIMDRMRLGLL